MRGSVPSERRKWRAWESIMPSQASIPVSPSTRDRVREIKGFDRTYDELLAAWAESHAESESEDCDDDSDASA